MINLKEHINNLRKAEAATPTAPLASNLLLFLGTSVDESYLNLLKSCLHNYSCKLYLKPIITVTQVEMYCKKYKVNKVISTSIPLLKKLLNWDKRAAPSLSNYAGSYFLHKGIEIVFLPPLKSLATVKYGKFFISRIVSKLTKKDKWFKPTRFAWELLTPEREAYLYSHFSKAFLISVDIETFRENAVIRCISYTGFFYSSASLENKGRDILSDSVVLPLDSPYALSIMRKWNKLSAPKVLQNGKYDISYLCRYSAPLDNYLYDTAHLFHSWYSELPKDLGFLNAFFIREATYWKDLSDTTDLYEYYKYNALDTWGTGNTFLAMLLEAPEWAISNYLKEFPLIFPCHLAEMTGFSRDMDKLKEARAEMVAKQDEMQKSLDKILGVPVGHQFNVASPKQVKQVVRMLGCKDIKTTEEKDLKKALLRHPLNERIISLILKIRKIRKLTSTYMTAGKEFSRQDDSGDTILYALNPHGTDTSRLASREHHFWCGLQIQNIPRGPAVKQTFIAYPDFYWGEADYEQAESRDTAYISADPKLIDSVENAPDFHKRNASLFFGIPEDQITKPIRQISKNVNHGANYNMGWFVLIDTMGEENVRKAQKLLGLPKQWTLRQVAEYLLGTFHKAYPDIAGRMYPEIVKEVMTTSKLESGGWIRKTFGNPSKSKQVLNSYIAHKPQCLNAQTLNKAFLSVFVNICLDPKYNCNFKLIAQIHDSILFQYRKGHEYLCEKVRELMEIPVTVTGYDEVERTFVVPVDINNGKKYWSELK